MAQLGPAHAAAQLVCTLHMIHGNIVIICLCLSVSNPLTLMSSVVMKVMMMIRFILMNYHPVTQLSLRMFSVIIIVI